MRTEREKKKFQSNQTILNTLMVRVFVISETVIFHPFLFLPTNLSLFFVVQLNTVFFCFFFESKFFFNNSLEYTIACCYSFVCVRSNWNSSSSNNNNNNKRQNKLRKIIIIKWQNTWLIYSGQFIIFFCVCVRKMKMKRWKRYFGVSKHPKKKKSDHHHFTHGCENRFLS